MNIALLGWSQLDQGAALGGGYNLVARQHALYLSKQGHTVSYLRSGQDFTPAGALGRGKGRIAREKDWGPVACYSLRNSANWAPADRNGSHPWEQTDAPTQDTLVIRWLKDRRVESVFIHSLEGQAFSLLKRIKREGMGLFLFCHDYYFLCPRVSLLYQDKIPCLNNDGSRCAGCLEQDPLFPLKRTIRRVLPPSGKTRAGSLGYERQPGASNGDLLASLARPRDNSPWGQRNRAALDALSHTDRVYSPSRFLGDALCAAGLARNKLTVLKIGLDHLDQLKAAPLSPGPEDGKIHFAFHGGGAYRKGAALLLEAYEQLPAPVKERCCFHLWGFDGLPDREGLQFHPAYTVDQLAEHGRLYHVGVLAHLWYENSPVAMLEHLAMGKPVLAPRLGGVEDYIVPGKNGWLFEPGNVRDLARCVGEIVRASELPVVDRGVVNSSHDFFMGCGPF